ncbi:MAG TPA: hypothetical protein EYQ64_00215 [Gemmatimonadetes bacterium]|nr:hypothetical protein [Gemmatimonadota bacterium]
MSLRTLFEWVDAFPSSIAMREHLYAFPALLTLHLISLAMFAGLVVMMDLRLLGVAFRGTPFSEVQRRLFPWQIVGFVVTSIAGLLLLYAQPMRYFGKVLYWIKIALILLAGVNMFVFHFTTNRKVAEWDTSGPPLGAKVAGGLSVFFWAGVVVFGRLTAYEWWTYE